MNKVIVGSMIMLIALLFACTATIYCQDEGINLPKEGFSGKFTDYVDEFNGYKMKIPVEYKLKDKGATTFWQSPLVDAQSGTLTANATRMTGVPSQVMYDTNLRSKKEDRNYTEVVPLKVKCGKGAALAFRCKESNFQPGTKDKKKPDDIHRWHLYVFANESQYLFSFDGAFSAFGANKFQPTYEAVIKSIEILPLKK
jgi:hypothetical protein